MNSQDEKLGFDVPAWLQVMFVALPAIVYAGIYFNKQYAYASFKVSSQLIQVRFEDILFLFVPFLVFGFTVSFLALHAFVIRNDKHISISLFGVIIAFIILVVQILLVANVMFEANRFDFQHVLAAAVCAVLFAAFMMLLLQLSIFKRMSIGARRLTGIVMIIAFVACFIVNAAYLSFHLSSYQICEADNALIVGYDNAGKAIEKRIRGIDSRSVCELDAAYYLVDVTGKDIVLRSFTYIDVAAE